MSVRLCSSCRKWRDCPGTPGVYDYFEPGEIKQYCFYQVIFLIANLRELEEYLYPPDPEESEAVGVMAPKYNTHVRGETAMSFYDVIQSRLDRTGQDGDTLVHEIKQHWKNTNHLPFLPDLSYAARNALCYVVGKEKRQKYGEWKSDREYYRAKLRQITVIAKTV